RKCDAPTLGAVVLERLGVMTPTARDEAFELLLSRPALATEFVGALEAGSIRLSELSLAQKQRLSTYPDRRLRIRVESLLAKGQENVNSDRKQVLAEYADLANAKGDAPNGKAVFKKTCMVCHRYQGEGPSV